MTTGTAPGKHSTSNRCWLRVGAISLAVCALAASCSSGDEDEAAEDDGQQTAEAFEALPEDFFEFHTEVVPDLLTTQASRLHVAADLVALCAYLATEPAVFDTVLIEMSRIGLQRAEDLGVPFGADESATYLGVLGDGMHYVCPEEAAYADSLLDAWQPQLSEEQIDEFLADNWRLFVGSATRWAEFPNDGVTKEHLELWVEEVCEILHTTRDGNLAQESVADRFLASVPDATMMERDLVTTWVLGMATRLSCPGHASDVMG